MTGQYNLLEEKPYMLFIRYLIPSIASSLIMSLCILFDTIFIGRGIGSEGLAALNIVLPVFTILIATGVLLGTGGAIAFSIDLGERKVERTRGIFTYSMVLAILVGVFYSLVGSFLVDEVAYLLGASHENIELVTGYLSAVMPFCVFYVVNNTLVAFLRNDGAPKLAMTGMILGNMLNIFLDILFIFKFGWGMKGAAFATGLSTLLMTGTFCLHFANPQCNLSFEKVPIKINIIRRIIKNGISSSLVELSSGLVIFCFNRTLLNVSGVPGVAAYGIIANIALICMAIFIGVSQAAQPIISFNYGAGKIERILKSMKLGVCTVIGMGIVFWATGVLFPQWIVSWFVKEDVELMKLTVRGISIYFTAFLIMGVNTMFISFFQAIEKSIYAMSLTFFRGFVLTILGLALLPSLFSTDGVWLTVPLSELIIFVISTILYIKLYKEKKEHCLYKPY
jgi:putative MATE family efflux protein